MFDPHPFLAAFPIVLVVVTLLLHFFVSYTSFSPCGVSRECLEQIVTFQIFTAALFGIVAFFSGYFANGYVTLEGEGALAELVATHHAIGRLSMLFILCAAAFRAVSCISQRERRRIWDMLFTVFLVLSTAITLYAGSLGGALVFEHGAGVSLIDNL